MFYKKLKRNNKKLQSENIELSTKVALLESQLGALEIAKLNDKVTECTIVSLAVKKLSNDCWDKGYDSYRHELAIFFKDLIQKVATQIRKETKS